MSWKKEGRGLNLSWEVRDGILKHSKGKGEILPQDPEERAATLEGQVVRIADIIAYISHDLDDALRGGLIIEEEIPAFCREVLGERSSRRINTMVTDLVTPQPGRPCPRACRWGLPVQQAMTTLQGFPLRAGLRNRPGAL